MMKKAGSHGLPFGFVMAMALMLSLVPAAEAWETYGPHVGHVTTFASVPDSEWLYATTEGGRIFRRSAATERWTSAGFPGQSPTSVAVDPADDRHLFAVVSRWLYESSNGGANWSRGVGDHSNATAGAIAKTICPPILDALPHEHN